MEKSVKEIFALINAEKRINGAAKKALKQVISMIAEYHSVKGYNLQAHNNKFIQRECMILRISNFLLFIHGDYILVDCMAENIIACYFNKAGEIVKTNYEQGWKMALDKKDPHTRVYGLTRRLKPRDINTPAGLRHYLNIISHFTILATGNA